MLDLESDGTDELCVIGDSIWIIDGNADVQWENSVMVSRISGDVVSDPRYHLNTGSINFIPSHDNDIRVIDKATMYVRPDHCGIPTEPTGIDLDGIHVRPDGLDWR